MGVPAAVEYLNMMTPQFIGDLVSWGAIGARTTESQTHREMASGLSSPVGFKNGTDGNIQIAIDAIKSSRAGHNFLSVNKQGVASIIKTTGNDCCHIILRGGSHGPNYESTFVESTLKRLRDSNLPPFLMVDFSHGNSLNYANQLVVAKNIVRKRKEERRKKKEERGRGKKKKKKEEKEKKRGYFLEYLDGFFSICICVD